MANWNIALDAGGTGIRMAVKRYGIIFDESAMGAYVAAKKTVVALGNDARRMHGRELPEVTTGVMLEGGRVSREALLDMWIPYLLNIAREKGTGRGNVVFASGANAREADLQAVRNTMLKANAGEMGVMQAEFAAALGVWLPEGAGEYDVMAPEGTMVVDIGGMSAFAALMAGGHVIRVRALPYGLEDAIAAIRVRLRTEYSLAAGDNTVQALLCNFADMDPERYAPAMDVPGLHLGKLLPDIVKVEKGLVWSALEPYVTAIGDMAAAVLTHAPDELAADIFERGILLTGGGAHVYTMAREIEKRCGVAVHISEEPENAVIRGLYRAINETNRFDDLILRASEK